MSGQCWWAVMMAATFLAQQAVAQDIQADETLDEVLISGERPGPGLWKVTQGDHTLWVLGVQAPLAKKMKWRSDEVERIIAQSQEFLGSGGIVTDVKMEGGFIDIFRSVAALSKLKKNPDDRELADVVPPDLYAKWLTLKKRYLGGSRSVERLRPLFAAIELEEAAIEKYGFEKRPSAEAVISVIKKAAKKHDLSTNGPGYKLSLHSTSRRSDVIKQTVIPPDADLECFREVLNELENRLELQRAQANAWAAGDIEALARLNRTESKRSCTLQFGMALAASMDGHADDFAITVRRIEAEWARGTEWIKRRWMVAAESAIRRNVTTFAVLPMYDVVGETGRIAALRAKGYAVVAPTD